jgi:gamma-glutamyltranspeptidase / glutathione hydrolase
MVSAPTCQKWREQPAHGGRALQRLLRVALAAAATLLASAIVVARAAAAPGTPIAEPGAAIAAPGTPIAGPGAAIAAPDSYGAEAAAETLRRGGNAVDAAIALAFTLAVTCPEAGNLGGGGFATLVVRGKAYFLDYRETAPRGASAGMYLDARGNVIPDASTVGAGAAAVPGTVAGLWALHQRFARLPWSVDVAAAIRYAREGFRPAPMLITLRDARVRELAGRTNFEHYFGSLAAGELYRQPELAATLEGIARQGPDGFYGGRTAGMLIAQMQHGGHITLADLRAYRPRWRAPLEGDWAGYRVITAPPPSAGGLMLLSLLAMRRDLGADFQGVTQNSAQYVHLLAEMEKRVFADRASYLGDPDFVQPPLAALLDPRYLARRAAEVNPRARTPTSQVHSGLDMRARAGHGPDAHHDTTHFSIIDFTGNAVSNTYTLNDDFGSGEVVEGAGFLLNNEMDDFVSKPGAPNLYGVSGGEANSIAPGKRPLSTMTPTILMRDGQVALVIGTPGGSRIATSIFQVLSNWHDFRLPLGQAVSSPRIHHQLLPPDTLFEEPYATLAPAVIAALEARGYRFVNQGWNGDIEATAVGPGGAEAVADPRGRGVGVVLAGGQRAAGKAGGGR